MRRRILLTAAILAASPTFLLGQSLFNAAGLGLPLDAVDARSRALGSLGIGLQGGALLANDPAAAALLGLPAGTMTGQPSWVDYSDSGTGASGSIQGNRFPHMGLAYPAFQGMVTLQLASFMDQRFKGERFVTVDLADGPADAIDRFTQEGGVSSASLGYARLLGEHGAVGLTLGRFTGAVVRELAREFTGLSETGAEEFVSSGNWSYSGYTVTGGGSTDLGSFARVAASATWSSGLDATATDSSPGEDRSYDLPLQLRVGASAVLAPGVIFNASASHANWSGIAADLTEAGTVGGTDAVGVGLEVGGGSFLGKPAPLRVGFRRSSLPFSLGTDKASERVFTGGFSLLMNQTNGILLASADFALERGRRAAGALSESFWRATVSLRVLGF